jgi:hypothetical protein
MTPLSAIGWGLSLPVGFRGPLTWPSAGGYLCEEFFSPLFDDPTLGHRLGAFSVNRLRGHFSWTPQLAIGRGLPHPFLGLKPENFLQVLSFNTQQTAQPTWLRKRLPLPHEVYFDGRVESFLLAVGVCAFGED